MSYITVSDEFIKPFIAETQLSKYEKKVREAHQMLHNKTGDGFNALGWLELSATTNQQEISRIKEAAQAIKEKSDVFVVIGVGGSYLGAKAAIELLSHSFYNQLAASERKQPQIIFIGNDFSSRYMHDVLELIDGKDFSINVISKSGTTLETAIGFHFLRHYAEEKYGKEIASKRIYVTTDAQHGQLKKMATENGYTTFHIPQDIGGRYSVLTTVGLLPMAVSGIDIDAVLQGAELAERELCTDDIGLNASYYYAALRNMLYASGKKIELLVGFEPHFKYFQEWWKQLFGESEGKQGKGLFPAAVIYSTDLHSIGQYIQDGERHLFQTVLFNENPNVDLEINVASTTDFLHPFSGKTLHELNRAAFEGAMLAHKDGGVPNIVLKLPRIDAFTFGYLVYFFKKACALSGYLLGVNPFDQPGVEAYKKNMRAFLQKTHLKS